MKKRISFFIFALLVSALLFAGGSEEKKDVVNLEFAVKETGSTLEAYNKIVENFNNSHDDIKVEIVSYGKDYQTLLKAKMAANDLPDLFTTHGWSVGLYGKYLERLNEREWVANLSPEIIGTVTDNNGNIVALPLDIDITGMVVNNDVLKLSGIEKLPENLDEFLDSCSKIKEHGFTPIHVAGKDASDCAGLFSRISLSILTTPKTQNYAESLYDGTFDWSNYDEIGYFVNNLVEKGYLNTDYLTADKSGTYKGLAENKVAFAFQSNQTIAEVKKLNPNCDIKMMKLPGYKDGDKPFLISGERDAVGVWKDGKNKEAALIFVDYLAQDENVKLVSEAYNLPPSTLTVKDVNEEIESLLSDMSGSYVSNHFDREYLPDGMWNTLKVYGSSILSKEMTPQEGSEMMKEEYLRLKK